MYTFHYTRCHLPQARSQFKSRSTANNVSILVPVPSDADSPKFKTTTGSTKWIPEKNVVQWNIKSFPVSASKIPLNLFNPFRLIYCFIYFFIMSLDDFCFCLSKSGGTWQISYKLQLHSNTLQLSDFIDINVLHLSASEDLRLWTATANVSPRHKTMRWWFLFFVCFITWKKF